MRIAIMAIVFVLLFFAACTPEQGATEQPEVQEAPEQSEDTQKMQEETEPEGSVVDELMGLFDKKAQLEYQVTYDMTSVALGEQFSGATAEYVKGVDKQRVDTAMQGIETRIIRDGEMIIACNKAAGDWMCTTMETEIETGVGDAQEDIESNLQSYDVSLAAPRTIAGALTVCFTIELDSATAEYCLTKEGVPLYIHTRGSAGSASFETTMTATSYSTSVASDVFTPPAEPGAMPNMDDMMAQYS